MKRNLFALVFVAAVAGSILTGVLHQQSAASRNSAGSYSLPAGNPVVSGTTITSTWANNTLNDLTSEMTDSLCRSGKGAMLAPLQLASGTVGAPGLTFSSETNSGLYRAGAGDIGVAISGAKVGDWLSTGLTVAGTITATSANDGVKGTSSGSHSGVVGLVGTATETGGSFAAVSGFANSAATPAGYFEQQGSAPALQVSGTTVLGSGSTGITHTYGATYNITFGTLTANTCGTSAQTLTGVSLGGVCNVSPDAALGTTGSIYCAVTGTNTISVVECNASASSLTQNAGNFRVRVWQP